MGPGWGEQNDAPLNTRIKAHLRAMYNAWKNNDRKHVIATFDTMLREYHIKSAQIGWVVDMIDDVLQKISVNASEITSFKSFIKQHLQQTHPLRSQLPATEHISALLQSMHDRITVLESRIY